ncbi:MAG: hypothetical protein J6S85_17575 [Methanobrevibacter sp.]|nr:hypothetical protein [Methanobrevibacter sp.]
MKQVTIYFKDDDVVTLECMDMAINNGFITVFMPENEEGVKTVQAYNVATVDSWTFEQKDEEGEEA